jgi:hypothetical protein
MATTTYGPGDPNHALTVLAMVDSTGVIRIIKCSPDSTITVTPLRGAPDPSQELETTSSATAGERVELLLADVAAP